MNIGILEEDVRALSYVYPVALDDAHRHIVLKDFNLPPGYNFVSIPVLLKLPKDYPESPPGVGDSGVFVPAALQYHDKRPKDLHNNVDPSGYWAWWCYERIEWDPCRDDLITFFELLRAHMTSS